MFFYLKKYTSRRRVTTRFSYSPGWPKFSDMGLSQHVLHPNGNYTPTGRYVYRLGKTMKQLNQCQCQTIVFNKPIRRFFSAALELFTFRTLIHYIALLFSYVLHIKFRNKSLQWLLLCEWPAPVAGRNFRSCYTCGI